jgi:hypothetical protein
VTDFVPFVTIPSIILTPLTPLPCGPQVPPRPRRDAARHAPRPAGCAAVQPARGGPGLRPASKKDAKLAQKLGQLQPFNSRISTAVHGPTCIFWVNLTAFSLQCAEDARVGLMLTSPSFVSAEGARSPSAASSTSARSRQGSVALSLCTAAHPRHTRFTNIFGASVSEATVRPGPRSRPNSPTRWTRARAACTR